MLDILIFTVLGLVTLGGIVLTVFNLPGVWLVFVSIILLAWYTGWEILTPGIVLILFAFSVVSTLVDNLGIILGAKKMGASTWGMVGAILGGIVGLVVGNFVGFLVGPIIGATLFEVVFERKDLKAAFKAGIGSFLGILISIILRLSIVIGMVVYVVSLFV